ncbi:hypothetical protein MPTK1_2g06660 [Marchantia polymorpha subsp. ruderalis]|uniref:Plastid lipid-associated protein/fibrillin conserved domain-containing protein n=1 Tax=Marchantia polymorpha TaxID=3197 RepID=A0A2R6XDT2_MARPO|nr:hypothetical protein MARPO_0021s0119 [Marchantia polymorpha]BBN01339.1 hypothetical protein Mp_2g06660 [Marchantia polymorpha subsp. ruderalis]|eukprot:PTQ44265.1 hypothetical protein MARPO_0021s0119 [Marchantia polymorpha]
MASSASSVISPASISSSLLYSDSNGKPCSFCSRGCSPSVVSFGNGNAKLRVAYLSSSRDFSNFLTYNFGGRNLGSGKLKPLHSLGFSEKRTSLRWSVVSAVSADTAQTSEAEASEESASQLVDKLLSLVKDSDRGALLGAEEQANVADVVDQLEKIGMPEPLKSPLIFGDWNVAYSSNPTSPGGPYRTFIGRILFRTRDMVQSVISPDVVSNVVRFALFGFIGGEVNLNGKLTPLDDKMIQVDFQPPDLQIGPFKFTYGGMSSVKISIIYLDDYLRLGRGSRGTVFVFTRR